MEGKTDDYICLHPYGNYAQIEKYHVYVKKNTHKPPKPPLSNSMRRQAATTCLSCGGKYHTPILKP